LSIAATPPRRLILVVTLETTPLQGRWKEAMHRTVSVYMADEIVLVQPVHDQHAPGLIPFQSVTPSQARDSAAFKHIRKRHRCSVVTDGKWSKPEDFCWL
jgi:hypothetical protein